MVYSLNHMVETGILDRLTIYWQARKPKCLQKAGARTDAVGLNEFYPAFIAFAIGILASLFVLIVEIIVNTFKLRRKQIDKAHRYPYVN